MKGLMEQLIRQTRHGAEFYFLGNCQVFIGREINGWDKLLKENMKNNLRFYYKNVTINDDFERTEVIYEVFYG